MRTTAFFCEDPCGYANSTFFGVEMYFMLLIVVVYALKTIAAFV